MTSTQPPLTYASAIRTSRTQPLFVLAVVGRLASGLVPFGVVATLTEGSGPAMAGVASGAYLYTSGLTAPFKGRLVDRRGLTALAGLAACFAGLAAAFTVAAHLNPGISALLVPALACAAPPAAAVIRTLWGELSPSDSVRKRLHALDSVLEESTFALSPLLVAAVWVTTGPSWAVLIGGAVAGLAIAGIGALVSRRHIVLNLPAKPARPKRRRRSPPVGATLIILPMVGLGAVMGVLGAVAPAWSSTDATAEFSGVVLAAASIAGALAGIIHGRLDNLPHPATQFLTGGLCLVGGALVMAVTSHPAAGILGAVFIGVAMTPMFTLAYVLVPERIPAASRTEANAAIGSAYNLSAATGAVLGGAVAALASPRGAFAAVAALTLVLTLAAAALGRKYGPSPAD